MDAAWRADGTIMFAVWRDGLYQVIAKGGTPALPRARSIRTPKSIFIASSQLLPDVARHRDHPRARAGRRLRADLVDGTRRTPLADDLDIASVEFSLRICSCSSRTRTNPGIWVAPFDGRTLDRGEGHAHRAWGATASTWRPTAR